MACALAAYVIGETLADVETSASLCPKPIDCTMGQTGISVNAAETETA